MCFGRILSCDEPIALAALALQLRLVTVPPRTVRLTSPRHFTGRAKPMHDLVIDNALLIDGTGAPARHASLAVQDGRIAAIGEGVGNAHARMDARGLALAP